MPAAHQLDPASAPLRREAMLLRHRLARRRGLSLAPEECATVVLQAQAGAQGIAVHLDSGDGAALGDRAKRQVGVGVVAVTACREDDLPARLAALERASA